MYSDFISCIWVQMLYLWRVRFTLQVFTESFCETLKDRHTPLTSLLFVFVFTRRLADLLPNSNSHETRYMNVTFLWKLKRSSMNKKKKGMAPQGQATDDWKKSAVSVRQVRRGKKCLWRQHRHAGPDCHVLSKVTLAATLTSICLLHPIYRR